MAQEITVTGGLSASKSGTVVTFPSVNQQRTWSGKDFDAGKQVINTTGTDAQGTAITIKSSCATGGHIQFRNCDSTNSCTVGPRVGGTYIGVWKLEAGEMSPPIRVDTITLYGSASGSALDLEFWYVEA